MSGCVMAQNDQTAEFLNNHPLLNRNRIAEFKKKINFDHKIATEEKTKLVKTNWQTLLKSPSLIGWKIVDVSNEVSPAGRTKGFRDFNFQLSQNDQVIFIKITDAINPDSARDAFLRKLNETSMPEIFQKSTAELIGTVSVEDSSPTQKTQNYMWVYKNILFEVSSKNVSSLLTQVKDIQKYAENSLTAR